MAGYRRTNEEIKEALDQQIRFLRTSCRAYDQGDFDEGVRLAATIFIIVHDGGKQRSLLTQLNTRPSFVSYATPPVPGNLIPDHPLVMMRIGSGNSLYVPKLDNGPPTGPHTIKFGIWWDKETIFSTNEGESLTRRQLVTAVRNQDGGGHSDAEITDASYLRFSRKPSWFVESGNDQRALEPWPHLPTIRHIAFELDTSLVKAGLVPS